MQERDCDLNSSIHVVNISDRAGELMSAHRRPTLKQPTRGLASFIEQPAAVFPMLVGGSETHEVSALRSTSRPPGALRDSSWQRKPGWLVKNPYNAHNRVLSTMAWFRQVLM